MPSWDFWNNPLIVSSLRVRYRKRMIGVAAPYVLALAGLGAVLNYYQARIGAHWPRIYFFAIVGIQLFVSGLMAWNATSRSMRTEVSQRTLDFQRITSLPPRQILLGKLLGEPANAYWLAIASIPLGVLCWLWGGVTFDGLVVAYVVLATTFVLIGTMGLVTRVDAEADGGKGPRTGLELLGPGGLLVTPQIFIGLIASGGGAALSSPGLAAALGLLTPVVPFVGVYQGDPFKYGLSFFEWEIPFAFVTPLAQLAIAAVCFRAMVRQLLNPLNPPLGKVGAYLFLIVVDVIAGGVLWDTTGLGMDLAKRAVVFGIVHCVACVILLNVTPSRDALLSWLWRRHERTHPVLDQWLGNRSDNTLALLTFSALGLVSTAALLALPVYWHEGSGPVRAALPVLAGAGVTMVVLVMAYGTIYQFLALLSGKGTFPLLFAIIPAGVVLPYIAGYWAELPWLMGLAPNYHVAAWLSNSPEPHPLTAMILLYVVVWIVFWCLLQFRLGREQARVDRTLRDMGVPVPA